MHDMKRAATLRPILHFSLCFQGGGGGRTRTYEGIASGFTVRPLCRSGHSPELPKITENKGENPRSGKDFRARVYAERKPGCQPPACGARGKIAKPAVA